MHFGVDFGTTRTIVSYADRGNYPVVSFYDGQGDAHEFFPSVVALSQGTLVYGFAALEAARQGAPLVRSFKRALSSPTVHPDTPISIGEGEFGVLEVLTGFFEALRTALVQESNVSSQLETDTLGKTAVAVPAHAHGAQRFLTLEAFRRAGFEVAAMINEPSAAGFEYTHRQGRTLSSRRTRVIVYDLGGGTFDASLVKVDGKDHRVLDSLGLNNLGGDDFDAVMAQCALDAAGSDPEALFARGHGDLVEECREAKERLTPQARRVLLEVDGTPVSVSVASFYAAATPLVEASIDAMRPLVGGLDGEPELTDIAGIYLVGGASGLPLVPRLLRERFGRRVHRSPYPAASTAIGLAIAVDPDAGYSLTDRLSRGFGVFREGSDGRTLQFDPLLTRDETLSPEHAVEVIRRYPARHNVGWYRFVEYSGIETSGEPRGDIMPFAEVLFAYDPALRSPDLDLSQVAVQRCDQGPLVEEKYVIDPHGMITVQITDLDTGYTQVQALQSARRVS